MTSRGTNELARAIDRRVRAFARRADPLELGLIGPDGALHVDHFGVAIPAAGYLVARGISPVLEAGDRVLVAWVNGGTDAVVVNVVVTTCA